MRPAGPGSVSYTHLDVYKRQLDNRPLRFDEFEERIPQFVYVSATPGDYEQKVSQQQVEQIIRPTGLLDPEIIVRSSASQIDDIIDEAKERAARDERVLITTLTKKMAEDLTDHLLDQGVKARYMHSDIATLERVEILRELRQGKFDVLVGINLLREGLDLPEVSPVSYTHLDVYKRQTQPLTIRTCFRTCATGGRHCRPRAGWLFLLRALPWA